MPNSSRELDPELEAFLLECLAGSGEDIELNQSFWDGLRAEALGLIKSPASCPSQYGPTSQERI